MVGTDILCEDEWDGAEADHHGESLHELGGWNVGAGAGVGVDDVMGWAEDIEGLGYGMWRGCEIICDGNGRVGVFGRCAWECV